MHVVSVTNLEWSINTLYSNIIYIFNYIIFYMDILDILYIKQDRIYMYLQYIYIIYILNLRLNHVLY